MHAEACACVHVCACVRVCVHVHVCVVDASGDRVRVTVDG